MTQDVGWLVAAVVYLYAGWCQAEMATAGPKRPKGPKAAIAVAYVFFVFGWGLFMPWLPRIMRRRKEQ